MIKTVKTVFLVLAVLFIAGNIYAADVADGISFKEPNIGMEFVFIKGGCYQMGETFEDSNPEEKPIHEVCVDDFYMGKYDVTVGEFRSFVNSAGYKTEAEKGDGCFCRTDNFWKNDNSANWRNPGFQQDEKHPVVCISWNDAVAFTKWIGATEETFRLPTEAEWEYAARSGGRQEQWAGTSNEAELVDYAWYNKNSGNKPHPTGQKKPNGLGLYDMSCNVGQWVEDWYDKDYYNISPRNNPTGPSSGEQRVLRGCAWYDDVVSSRATARNKFAPGNRGNALGFRLARNK